MLKSIHAFIHPFTECPWNATVTYGDNELGSFPGRLALWPWASKPQFMRQEMFSGNGCFALLCWGCYFYSYALGSAHLLVSRRWVLGESRNQGQRAKSLQQEWGAGSCAFLNFFSNLLILKHHQIDNSPESYQNISEHFSSKYSYRRALNIIPEVFPTTKMLEVK